MNRTFHQEGEEQNEEEEVEKGLTMEQQFLQLVLQNVRHFISLSGQPAWQLAALGKQSVGFNADSDPTLYLNADPDSDMKYIPSVPVIGNRTYRYLHGYTSLFERLGNQAYL